MDDAKVETAIASSEPVELADAQYYFNRELSWIEFDRRVLNEGMDRRNPLLERLKFLAIFSSNLDEFFMVRVAALLTKVGAGVTKAAPDGRSPQQQLDETSDRLRPLVQQQHEHFSQELRPAMAVAGIYLLDYVDLNQEQRAYLHDHFEREIFPVLTPLAVDPAHPFPRISNLSSNLVVLIQDPDSGEEHFARVKIPQVLSRFLPLPLEGFDRHALAGPWAEVPDTDPEPVWVGVPIEQAIAHNLELLFPGMNILEYHPFRVTRNSDIAVEDDETDDLMVAIEQELRKQRLGGNVVRLEVLSTMPTEVRDRLVSELEVLPGHVFDVEGLLGLNDLFSFLRLPLPHLKDKPWTSMVPKRIQRLGSLPTLDSDDLISEEPEEDQNNTIFAELQRGDLLVHHPYHSFAATVQRFITEAANDPKVLAYGFRSWSQWLEGDSAAALADTAECAAASKAVAHPFDRCWQLLVGSLAFYFTGDRDALARNLAEAKELGETQNVDFVNYVMGPVWTGLLHILDKEWEDAIAAMTPGVEIWKATGGGVILPFWEGSLAIAHAGAGRREVARALLDGAIARAEETGETWYLPVLHRLLAGVLAGADDGGARESLARARALAEQSGALGVARRGDADFSQFAA